MKKRVEALENKIKEFEGHDEKIKKLEEKNLVHEDRINELNERINNLEGKFTEMMLKVNEVLDKYSHFDEKIKLMESLNSSGNEGGDFSGTFNFN